MLWFQRLIDFVPLAPQGIVLRNINRYAFEPALQNLCGCGPGWERNARIHSTRLHRLAERVSRSPNGHCGVSGNGLASVGYALGYFGRGLPPDGPILRGGARWALARPAPVARNALVRLPRPSGCPGMDAKPRCWRIRPVARPSSVMLKQSRMASVGLGQVSPRCLAIPAFCSQLPRH